MNDEYFRRFFRRNTNWLIVAITVTILVMIISTAINRKVRRDEEAWKAGIEQRLERLETIGEVK